MTIVEAIAKSLKDIGKPATYEEVYSHIVSNDYFRFGAKSPISVIRVKLRLHSINVDISSGKGKKKFFRSEGGQGKNERFVMLDEPIYSNIKESHDRAGKIVKSEIIKRKRLDEIIKNKWSEFDFSIHKVSVIECFWMLLGSLLPIIVDSLLRVALLNSGLDEAFKNNLKSGEVFLLTSALIMPFFFTLIKYVNSDHEEKELNKLPYFGWVFFITICSLLAGIFTFVYYRIGQHVRDNAESDVVKSMFSFDFGSWAVFIFFISLVIWYYSSYMNHRSTNAYKAIRKRQAKKLENNFENNHREER
ncbi:hypothetical protein CWC29_022100 [Pseudoalteromonas sp. S4498]|uniref:hypothetical protein n=1 Tax=Pseudoalteromonas galatheae TaxID=579562 RepID=UPI0011080317|nr:hypothetical protein [Pseudoalteromonas galatheae]NKC21474.1 hypothetical protein [Pseudoalteromonas galatheae]